MSKPRYVMTMDTIRCVGCNCCVIACKTENAIPNGGFRDWIRTETRGTFPDLAMEIHSERCNHCDNPPCVGCCPTGASHVNKGGVVLVNHGKCTGCKACMAACPYDSRYVHPQGYVDKCTFCLHRVVKGKTTACVSECPTKALTFGDLNDPRSEVSKLVRTRKYKVLKPETGAKPQHFFLFVGAIMEDKTTVKPFWNPYVGGAVLGLVLLTAFVVTGRGLGASGAASRVGITALDTVASGHVDNNKFMAKVKSEKRHPLNSWFVFMALGVVLGGFVAAYSAGRFRKELVKGPRISSRSRLILALGGGLLMGIGARLALGCTSGQALTGGALLSVGSWIFMMAVFAGGYAAATLVRRQWL